MGATSVTGAGLGDAHKRIAYLSSDLPRYKFTKTTTNTQDLITGEAGGGCDCDFDTEWELIYSASEQEGGGPVLFAPLKLNVDSGVEYDKMYTWAFGIHEVPGGTLFPVTDPILYNVVDLHVADNDWVGMEWSPNGGSNIFQFNFGDNEFSILRPSLMPTDDFIVLQTSPNSRIEYDAGTGTFETYFGAAPPGTVIYFVIARRRIVAL